MVYYDTLSSNKSIQSHFTKLKPEKLMNPKASRCTEHTTIQTTGERKSSYMAYKNIIETQSLSQYLAWAQ